MTRVRTILLIAAGIAAGFVLGFVVASVRRGEGLTVHRGSGGAVEYRRAGDVVWEAQAGDGDLHDVPSALLKETTAVQSPVG